MCETCIPRTVFPETKNKEFFKNGLFIGSISSDGRMNGTAETHNEMV